MVICTHLISSGALHESMLYLLKRVQCSVFKGREKKCYDAEGTASWREQCFDTCFIGILFLCLELVIYGWCLFHLCRCFSIIDGKLTIEAHSLLILFLDWPLRGRLTQTSAGFRCATSIPCVCFPRWAWALYILVNIVSYFVYWQLWIFRAHTCLVYFS